MPGEHRREDQGVREPAPVRARIRDQTHPGEVELALRPGLAVIDANRRPGPTALAALGHEPGQRPIRHRRPLPGQQIADLDGGQPAAHPGPDLFLARAQRVPRRPEAARPTRPAGRHHRADQPVIQSVRRRLLGQPGRLRRLHVAADRLTVHPRQLGRPTHPVPSQPDPQHFPDLDHRHLPVDHPPPPRRTVRRTGSGPRAPPPHDAPGGPMTGNRVVPCLWRNRGQSGPLVVAEDIQRIKALQNGVALPPGAVAPGLVGS